MQGARLDDGAREDMRADFAAFFDDADGQVRVQLFELDRGGQTRRAGADDQYVELHGLARLEMI